MKRKCKSPYFVSAELLSNGAVRLVDDDGEVFNVEMRHDQEWPMLSSQVRNREMRAAIEEMHKRTPPQGPFKPKIVA
jgi:hypothetical protein